MITSEINTVFPSQKKSFTQKTKQWGIDCINAAERIALHSDPIIRKSYRNKLINFNLANGILDVRDVERVCNRFGFSNNNAPAKMQNYPIMMPKLDLLVGEERNRRFDYMVKVVNPEAVSDKEREKKTEWEKFFDELLKQVDKLTDRQINDRVENFKKYMNYEWQDLRERRATHLLNYLYKQQKLTDKFNRGFENALISSEEIFCAEVIDNSPVLRECNPLNIHTIRSGESPWINDADIILEDMYMSPNQVLDKFHEYLTDKEVKMLEENNLTTDSNNFITIGEREASLNSYVFDIDEIRHIDAEVSKDFGSVYDAEGNIRVIRVLWKSKRKVGRLSYLDKDGDEVEFEMVTTGYDEENFTPINYVKLLK
jgi:hypothetical protein